MTKVISSTSQKTPHSAGADEHEGISNENAREQHKRWLGEDRQSPDAPYDSDRVSTPAREGQPPTDDDKTPAKQKSLNRIW